MAYLSLIRIPGDSEELLQGPYQRMSSNMSAVAPEHGLISHVAAKTDDGLLIVNVWPSKAASEASEHDPRRAGVLERAAIDQGQIRREHHEGVRVELFERAT